LSRETQLPAIPNSSDPSVKALKEALEVRLGRRGDALDRGLTLRDLYENGVIDVVGLPVLPVVGGGSGGLPIRPRPIIGDTSQPPAPVSVTAVGGFTGIIVSWAKPQRKDLTAHIYRNTVDTLSTAVAVATSSGQIFSDSVAQASTYYYWVLFVSAAEVTGPFNATAGTVASTSTINDAIPDATINVAKIANLVVDMASVTGTLTASQVSAGLITSNMVDAAGISADKITMDGNIEFANTQSGVQFGKTSLGDSQAGAFFGRSGGVAGFNISSSTSGIYADSAGQVALNNVRLYTGSAGSAAEFPNPGTFTLNISSISTSISVIIIGGGGGACNNSRSGTGSTPYGARAGTAGTASWLKWYSGLNGTGSVLATYNAAGGSGVAAGSVGSPNSSASGAAGQASSKAAGGVGGNYGYNFTSTPPTSGTLGSGGGGAAAITTNSSSFDCPVIVSAGAGATVSQLINKPSGAQSVKLFVGTGGTGGQGFSQFIGNNGNQQGTNITAGGNGGNGFVSVADPNSGGIEVDLLSIVNRLTAAGI
jgi:hypothetical protein